jgi:hypothetical protein
MLSDLIIIAGLTCIFIGVLGLVLRQRPRAAPADADGEETQ